MSPSLKYLMVWSIAARNASSDPMSLTATLGVWVACVLLVMSGLAPDADRDEYCVGAPRTDAVNARDLPGHIAATARPGGLTARRPFLTRAGWRQRDRTRTQRRVQGM